MNTSGPKQCDKNLSLDVEVMFLERQDVALLGFRSLLTPPLQLQSVLNSPSIKTNEVIPESEQSRIRSLLQEIESELNTIHIQTTHAPEYILLLQDKRAGYVEDMKKLLPGIAPHKSLPPEILVEIFLHYAAKIAEQVICGTALRSRCLSQFPWVLGQICSRWRKIALAEPRIWGTISFNALSKYNDLLMLNEAFRRGGQSRLWLSAHEGEDEKHIYDDFIRDVICSQSKRITELSLFVFAGTFEEFLCLPSDSFPVLEAVRLVANGLDLPWMHGFDVSVFRGAARLRRMKIATPLDGIPVAFPMNMWLCWPQLTHIDFPEISIQVSIAHELMNLCINLCECCIRLEENWESLPPVWIKFHPPSSIRIPCLWRLDIHQKYGVYVARVFNEFLRPLVMPNLQQFNFSLEEEPNIVPSLSELTAIVSGLSRPTLDSEMLYLDESGLTEVTGALPFVTSLKAFDSVLTPARIRMMAQEDHLPNLTSLATEVAYVDMDAFIDMLLTRWMRGLEARQSGCSNAGTIISATIRVSDAPSLNSISQLSSRIRKVQDMLQLKDARIELVDLDSFYGGLFR